MGKDPNRGLVAFFCYLVGTFGLLLNASLAFHSFPRVGFEAAAPLSLLAYTAGFATTVVGFGFSVRDLRRDGNIRGVGGALAFVGGILLLGFLYLTVRGTAGAVGG
jgi:hypothetical protein